MLRLPPDAIALGTLFVDRGHEIRIVGGWVRDFSFGRKPKDLDFCTTALPEQIIDLCERHGLDHMDGGLKHGTVGIIYRGVMYEVTTLRVDVETDGRHATVEFTTDWRADAARRDFTFNAMSADLAGNVYDYFGGLNDLHHRRVHFVGDPLDRIQEDYLRILRFYRFKGWIGDEVDETQTEHAITDTAEGLRDISVERVWAEMSRILAGPNLKNVLFSMWVCNVFPHIGIENCNNSDILKAVDARALTDNPVTVLAALTESPMDDRWRFSRVEAALFRWLQENRNPSYIEV